MRNLIRAGCVAVAITTSLAVGSACAALNIGAVPPDYLGKTPDRDEVHISQFKGTVVVVTFWASWCGYCLKELPVLERLQQVAGQRVHVVAVDVKDSSDAYKFIRRQLKDPALTFTHDFNGKISDEFGVHSYPNLYVIDQSGVIASVHIGYGDDSLGKIVADINQLLIAGAANATTTTAGADSSKPAPAERGDVSHAAPAASK